MPIYEFQCNECGRKMEILLSARDIDLAACSGCGSRDLTRLLSVPAPASTGSRFPSKASERCCGAEGPNSACAGPGSCCGKR